MQNKNKKPYCLIFAGKSNRFEPLRMNTLKLGRAVTLIRPPASKGTWLRWPRSVGRQVAVLEQREHLGPSGRGLLSIEGCGGVAPKAHSDRPRNRQRQPARDFARRERTAHFMNAGYEQSKLKAQDGKPPTERERERKHNETTHSSPDLKPRGRQIADQRKLWLSAGCTCLSALRRVILDWTRLD